MTNGSWSLVILLEQRPSAAAVAGDEVDDNRAGQDQNGVFGRGDVDAEALAGRFLRRASHDFLAPLEGVVVVVKISLGAEVVGAGDIDEEVAAVAGQRLLRNLG